MAGNTPCDKELRELILKQLVYEGAAKVEEVSEVAKVRTLKRIAINGAHQEIIKRFTTMELQGISRFLPERPSKLTDEQILQIFEYLDLVSHLEGGRKIAAISYLPSVYDPSNNGLRWTAKVWINRLQRYEGSRQRYHQERMRSGPRVIEEEELLNLANAKARLDRLSLESRIRGCSQTKFNPMHKQAFKSYAAFSFLVNTSSNSFSYSLAQRHKGRYLTEEERALGITKGPWWRHDSLWWDKFRYEIVMTGLLSQVQALLMGIPQGAYVSRLARQYAAGSVFNLFDTRIYAMRYGVSEKEAEKELLALANSPEVREKIKDLMPYLKNAPGFDKIKSEVRNTILAMQAKDPQTSIELEVGLDYLNNDEELRQAMLDALSVRIYDNQAGHLIRTGEKGWDRFTWSRLWNLTIGDPFSVAIGMMNYQIICVVGQVNMKKAIGQAVVVHAVYKVINDLIQFPSRNYAINQ